MVVDGVEAGRLQGAHPPTGVRKQSHVANMADGGFTLWIFTPPIPTRVGRMLLFPPRFWKPLRLQFGCCGGPERDAKFREKTFEFAGNQVSHATKAPEFCLAHPLTKEMEMFFSEQVPIALGIGGVHNTLVIRH